MSGPFRALWTGAATVAALALGAEGLACARPLAAPPGAPAAVQLAQLSPQMRQAVIAGVQEELSRRGYKVGPADGVLGSRTRTAIRTYQRDAGLPVDGVASKELLDHLKFAQPAVQPRGGRAAAPGAELRQPVARQTPQRSSRDLVLAVQRELQVRGYYTGGLDGSAGPATRAAVRAFQRDAGFPVTGDVDERLLAELRVVEQSIRAGRQS